MMTKASCLLLLVVALCCAVSHVSADKARVKAFLEFVQDAEGRARGHVEGTFDGSQFKPRVRGGAYAFLLTNKLYHGTQAQFDDLNDRSFYALEKGYAVIGMVKESDDVVTTKLPDTTQLLEYNTLKPPLAHAFLLVTQRADFQADLKTVADDSVHTNEKGKKENVNTAIRFCKWTDAKKDLNSGPDRPNFEGLLMYLPRSQVDDFVYEAWIKSEKPALNVPYTATKGTDGKTVKSLHDFTNELFAAGHGRIPDDKWDAFSKDANTWTKAKYHDMFYADQWEVVHCKTPGKKASTTPAKNLMTTHKDLNTPFALMQDFVMKDLFASALTNYPLFAVQFLSWCPEITHCLNKKTSELVKANVDAIKDVFKSKKHSGVDIDEFIKLLDEAKATHAEEKSRVETLAAHAATLLKDTAFSFREVLAPNTLAPM